MAVLNALSYMPPETWAAAVNALNAELTRRKTSGEQINRKTHPRIMITGSPIVFPNIKVPLLIEETGGSIVADETCMGDRFFYDPVSVADDSFDGILRAMSNRYIRPCTCPSFSDNSQRLYRIRQMVKENAVEGIVYHVLRGCVVYDFEYQAIEEDVGKLGIPIIRVESDYTEEDVEQLRIRIEAFIELIKLKALPAKEGK
jgi:benzoyl-CoA reductase/2-hydroxyglutaryl-CoA dehydratase subunit BcrC/BadD/HgdB